MDVKRRRSSHLNVLTWVDHGTIHIVWNSTKASIESRRCERNDRLSSLSY